MTFLFYSGVLLGFVLLVTGAQAAYHNLRIARTVLGPPRWRFWLLGAYAVGLLCVATVPFQHLPTSDGRVFGLPFFAYWVSTRGVVDLGTITVPALVCDAIVWFLVPQLVLAFTFRRQLQPVAHHPSRPA